MNTFVVDTNVTIVANGTFDTHADQQCQLECVERLERLTKQDTVAVDKRGLILKEYSKYLCRSGKPGVGDIFFKFIHDQKYTSDRVRQVSINPSENDGKGFEELPVNTFDPSDRKFLAVAVVAKAVVLNATDSDWVEHASLLEKLGVEVDQLCPQHASK